MLFLLAAVKFYWIPGYRLYTMGDGPPHFLNTWMVYEALRHGEIPFWTNYWACGSPLVSVASLTCFSGALAVAGAGIIRPRARMKIIDKRPR